MLEEATSLIKSKSKTEAKGEAKYYGDGFMNA
jgi:hypothetical protein